MKLWSPTTRLLRSRAFFYCSIALLMVGLRLLFFDYTTFFQLKSIPDHDMYQGAPFFAFWMEAPPPPRFAGPPPRRSAAREDMAEPLANPSLRKAGSGTARKHGGKRAPG